jgi:hypothetical protein
MSRRGSTRAILGAAYHRRKAREGHIGAGEGAILGDRRISSVLNLVYKLEMLFLTIWMKPTGNLKVRFGLC